MYKRILAIGAHPDDVEYSCFGFLKKEKNNGAIIDILIMTEGEGGNFGNGKARRNEQETAFSMSGFNTLKFLSFNDGQIPINANAISCVEELINKTMPDLILTHYPNDWHQDHVNTSSIVRAACRNYPKLWYYKSYSAIEFNPEVFVDISDVIDLKSEILNRFNSQILKNKDRGIDFPGIAIDENKYFGNQVGVLYAEAFSVYKQLL